MTFGTLTQSTEPLSPLNPTPTQPPSYLTLTLKLMFSIYKNCFNSKNETFNFESYTIIHTEIKIQLSFYNEHGKFLTF